MKILLSEAPGGPDTLVLTDVTDPQPAAGEVRVAMRAVGVNFPDLLIIQDLYQYKPQRPFAPGAELAGIVDALGEGVTDFAIGDRVMALPISGAMAEKVCVAATMCHKLPDDVSDKLAAGLQMTHGTALYALVERGAISKGDTVLVLGAAGGVGLAAVEIATALGARVIAAVSSEDKLEVARAHGAEDGVIYPQGPLDRDAQKALSSAFRDKLGADGADIVVDTVGGDFAEPALRATGWLGRYLVIGFPAGIP
ncbi:hypothetical protein LCGC14_3051210, partial [marine sediment metagenome]